MIKLKELLTESNGGDCYQVAGNFLVDKNSKKYTLVHGMVNGHGELTGLKFGHAWIEVGNMVIDNSNGRNIKMDKPLYYQIGHIKSKDCIYYPRKKLVEFILSTGHWGPWEMSGNAIKLREDIPTKRKEIGKRYQKVDMKNLQL